MAQVAHRINELLLPERRSSYAHSSQVDGRSQTRHSSVLVPHHGRLPRAPCPSPDTSDAPEDVNADKPSSISTRFRARTFNGDETIAKLTQLGSSEVSLIASGFDGSASQHENPNLSYRRRSSQPEMEGDTMARAGKGEIPANEPKSNQASHGSHSGQGRQVSSKAKRSAGPRMPMFNLQTIPPTSSGAVEKAWKPEKLHIPGSFGSETETSTLHSVYLRSPSDKDDSVAEEFVPVSNQSNPKPSADFHSLAVEALKKAKDRDGAEVPPNPISKLRKEPSQATLMSTTSIQQARHALSKPAAGQSVTGRAAEPIMTPGMGQGLLYSENPDMLSLLKDLHGPESNKPPSTPGNLSSADDEVASIINHPASTRSSHSRLSDSLESPLPTVEHVFDRPDENSWTPDRSSTPQPLPTAKHPVDEPDEVSRTLEQSSTPRPLPTAKHPADEPDENSRTPEQSSTPHSLPTAKSPLDEPDEISRTTEQSSTPHPLSFSNTLLHRRKSAAPVVISKTSSADTSSIISRDGFNRDSAKNDNVEPVVAAPQVVSNKPSLIDSPTHQERNHALGERAPLSKSQSLSFQSKASGAIDTAETKLHGSSPKPAGEEQAELKVHWIRQLLASASSNSLSPNYQTMNPGFSRQPSFYTDRSAFQQAEASGTIGSPKKQSRFPSAGVSKEKLKEVHQQRSTEPFTRTIQDLESLLKEALLIAKQAVDPGNSVIDLPSTKNPVSHKSFRSHKTHSVDSSHGSNDSGESISSRSEGADEEAQYTTLPKGIGRLRSEPAFNSDVTPHSKRSLAQALSQPLLILPNQEHVGTDGRPHQESTVKSHQRSPQEIGGMGDDGLEATRGVRGSASQGIELAQLASPDTKANTLDARDWALVTQPSYSQNLQPPKDQTSSSPTKPLVIPTSAIEKHDQRGREDRLSSTLNSEPSMLLSTERYRQPSIQPRTSSARLRPQKIAEPPVSTRGPPDGHAAGDARTTDLQPSAIQPRKRSQPAASTRSERGFSFTQSLDLTPERKVLPPRILETPIEERGLQPQDSLRRGYSLTGRRHVSLRGGSGFSLTRSHRRAPIARDWSPSRKRYVATVTCMNTALMGLMIGIYAGEVPAIQYAIVDEDHYTILGNVVFFIGLAITTLLAWPLPLLHGRKPYTLAAFALILPLQFPQALAVAKSRSPYLATYRVALLLPRAIAGVIMGFANINFKTTLLDLFGASLQSSNPHQEVVSVNDVRRHGGGMGVWLGIWTWCSIGSIGIGFLLGAVIIGELDVIWGFWLSIILTASALVVNVLVPEVRRSPYRRSMAEVTRGSDVSRRVARGEIKMHLDATGPIWWGEELMAGQKLCFQMLKQPGFAILALYVGWIYGQIIMVIVVSDWQDFFFFNLTEAVGMMTCNSCLEH